MSINDDPYFTPDPAPRNPRGRVANYDEMIDRHGSNEGVDPDLIRAVMGQESGGKATARSPKGAGGLMQLMPGTAARFGVKNVNDPEENIRGGTKYLKFLSDRYKGDVDKTLAAYNAGEGNVDKYGGVPPFRETQNYVPSVKARYKQITGREAKQNPKTPQVDPYFTPDAPVQGAVERAQKPEPLANSLQGTTVRPMVKKSGLETSLDTVTQQMNAVTKRLEKKAARTPRQPVTPVAPSEPGFAGNPMIPVNRADAMAQAQANERYDQGTAAATSSGVGTALRMAGMPKMGKTLDDWIGEVAAKGVAGLGELTAGVARNLPHDPFSPNPGTRAANKINRAVQEISAGAQAMDRQANRSTLSQGAQDVLAGTVSSAPAMALVSLGVPAPVAFGLQSYLAESGRDAEFSDILKETAKGATIGALFELPIPAKVALAGSIGERLARAGVVGGGTKLVDLASGDKGNTNAGVNAMFGALGAKGEVPEVAEAPQPASIAPVIADARAERVAANTQGASPLETIDPKLARTALGTAIASREGAQNEPGLDRAGDVTSAESASLSAEGQEPSVAFGTTGTRAVADVPRHVDLQARYKRGERAGDFKKETKAQSEARREQVNQESQPATEELKRPFDPYFTPEENVSETPAAIPKESELPAANLRGGQPEVPRSSVGERDNVPQRPTAKPEGAGTDATSIKNAATAELRSDLDLLELEGPEKKSWQTTIDNAIAKGLDKKAESIAEDVISGKKADGLSDEESAGIQHRMRELENQYEELHAKDPLDSQLKDIKDRLSNLTRAAREGGTPIARALSFRRSAVDKEFNLINMVLKAEEAKGRELTPQEHGRYEKMADEIKSLKSQLELAQEKGETKSLQREIDKVKRTTRRQETKAVLDDEFASLKQQFAVAKIESRKGIQASGLAGLDPEGKLTPLIAKMARNRVKAGVTDAIQLVDEIHSALREHIEGLSKGDIRDAVMGFGFPDSANKRRQTQLLKQEQELGRRLNERDFSKVKREPPVYTRETAGLQKQIEQIKAQYNNELYKVTRGTRGRIYDEAAKFGNLPKSLRSMADVSAMFRQGGFYALTHPIEGLAKPTKAMLQAFTETGYRNVESAIKADPNFDLAKRSGVEFTGTDKNDPKLAHKEEGYLGMGALETLSKGRVNPIRLVKGVADFSERTFVSFLDSQRMHIFNQMAEGLKSQGITQRSNPEAYKAIASLINQGTGRGNLGRMGNNAAPLLNLVMFSPRLVASRVQLLNNMFNPAKMASMPRGARSIMIKDNVRFLAATATALGLAKAAGLGVNTDPDDGDFLKIRAGKTTYDTLTGLQQPLRYIMNMGRAAKARATGDETYAGQNMGDLTTRFARSKLSPLAGVATDYLTGEDFSGRKFSAGREARDLITPLPANDFIDAMRAEGLIKGAVKAAPGLTGIGVQTYDTSPEKPTTQAEKLARKMVRDKMPDDARTDEEIDKSKKISDLRARSRRGEDISADVASMGSSLTNRQTKALLNARNVSKLQEDVKGLSLRDALLIYSVSKPDEQAKLRDIIGEKAATIDLMKIEDQGPIRKQMSDLGFKPGMSRPKRPERPDRPDRVNRKAWSYAP